MLPNVYNELILDCHHILESLKIKNTRYTAMIVKVSFTVLKLAFWKVGIIYT